MIPVLSKVNISIVLVTILVINIFATSPTLGIKDIIDGKHSLDSSFDPILNQRECDCYYTENNKLCDMNKYLSYPMKQKIGAMMEKARTLSIISCPYKTDGIEFGVFIMSSFNDYHSVKINQGFDIAEASKFYAKLFHERWEIGNEECNNGILIFLNVNDRFIYISTSTYLKMNYISNQYINNDLLPSIRPDLKNGKYGDAISKIIESITDKCQQKTLDKMIDSQHLQTHRKYTSDKPLKQHQLPSDSMWNIVVTVLSIVFLVWFMREIGCFSCCCGDDECNDTHAYDDEGRPSSSSAQSQEQEPGRQPQNISNRMNVRVKRNSYLRSRKVGTAENVDNVGNGYPKQQFKTTITNGNSMVSKRRKSGGGGGISFDDDKLNDRLKKERGRKHRVEKAKREKEQTLKEKQLTLEEENDRNEELVNDGKRTSLGNGGGMSWGENSSDTMSPSPEFNYTDSSAGGGTSW